MRINLTHSRWKIMLTGICLMLLVACGGSAEPEMVEVEVVKEVEVEKEVTVIVETEKEIEIEVTREVPVEVIKEMVVEVPVGEHTTSPVFTPFDDKTHLGESKVWRSAETVYTSFTSSNLTPDYAMTLWYIVFNYPEKCVAGPFQCGPPDLGSNRDAMGDFVFIPGAGEVIGADGTVTFSGSIGVGDASTTGLTELPEGCVPGFEGCGDPVGLINPDGALVIPALHSHGPALEGDDLAYQLSSYLGGCDAIIGTIPGGLSGSPDEIPDEAGECATIHISPHAPVMPEAAMMDEMAEPHMMAESSSPAFHPYDADNPVGTSVLFRGEDAIHTAFSASGLTPGYAMTLWYIIFNEPELCEAGPFQCGPPDLGSNRAAMGDFVFIPGAGSVVGDDGTVSYTGSFAVGEMAYSGLPELPEGCVPGNEGCGDPVGLINPDGALVIVALHSHGPALEGDELEHQLSSYLGGCEAVIGTLPGGFSASLDEIPDAAGECATIVISPHAP